MYITKGINDYAVPTLDFSLTSSQDQVDIQLTAIDDDFLEDLQETFTISMTLMTNQVNILTDIATPSLQVTIMDNEGTVAIYVYRPVIVIVLANMLSFC